MYHTPLLLHGHAKHTYPSSTLYAPAWKAHSIWGLQLSLLQHKSKLLPGCTEAPVFTRLL